MDPQAATDGQAQQRVAGTDPQAAAVQAQTPPPQYSPTGQQGMNPQQYPPNPQQYATMTAGMNPQQAPNPQQYATTAPGYPQQYAAQAPAYGAGMNPQQYPQQYATMQPGMYPQQYAQPQYGYAMPQGYAVPPPNGDQGGYATMPVQGYGAPPGYYGAYPAGYPQATPVAAPMPVAPVAAPRGGPGPMTSQKEVELQQMIQRYQINNYKASELWNLAEFDLVFILDDSGSMNKLAGKMTRWQELQQTVSQVIDIGRLFDDDGMDVYFLNRPAVKNIRTAQDLAQVFVTPPRGSTPLARAVEYTVKDQSSKGSKPMLLVIATDGVPDDQKQFRKALDAAVNNPTRRIRVQFLACSDVASEIGWLNDLDKEMKGVDVTDDYETERAEVLKAGRVKEFSRGDYVCKALLGGISDAYDKLDEGGDETKSSGEEYEVLNATRVYGSPGKNGEEICGLEVGARVKCYEKKGAWIRHDLGWSMIQGEKTQHLKRVGGPVSGPPEAKQNSRKVVGGGGGPLYEVCVKGGLRVRHDPGGGVIGLLENGRVIECLEIKGAWLNHPQGWSMLESNDGKKTAFLRKLYT